MLSLLTLKVKLILAGILLLGIGWYVVRAEIAKGKVEGLELQVTGLRHQLEQSQADTRTNRRSYEECERVNHENSVESDLYKIQLDKVTAELAVIKAVADNDIGRVNDEAKELRERGADCPAVNDEFRQWVRGSP